MNQFVLSNAFDTKTLAVLVFRTWQAFAGLVTLGFVTNYLSPIAQGYYYTFASLAALLMIMDTGLSIVLIQVASHEFVGLVWGKSGLIVGDTSLRFINLIRKSIRWYGVCAILFLLTYPIGLVFIWGKSAVSGSDWHLSWLILVLSTALNFTLLPVLTLVEGSGRVVESYIVRLLQSMVGACAVWVTLALGGGLYCVSMMAFAGVVVSCIWLVTRYRELIRKVFVNSGHTDFDWRSEVWPMQWRLGISWFCGYFLTQMHTPLLFRTQNPIVAGQMGLTMTVTNMLSMIALAWMTSRVPALGRAVRMRDWSNLDYIHRTGSVFSLLIFLIGAVGFVVVRILLINTPYGVRFLPVEDTVLLIIAFFLSHVINLIAIYIRAHRSEPFVGYSIIMAVLTASLAIYVAPKWGAFGIVNVLVGVNGLFGIPVSVWLWLKLRKEIHGYI